MRIEKAARTGFCLGVRRAINMLEKIARERGGIETLGAVVHNQQVLQKLSEIGVKVAREVTDISGDTVVTSTHGVSPELEEEIRERHIEVISTTCPFVRRAHVAARRLSESGFLVIVYGDADHPEVKGILGWTKGQGIATLDAKSLNKLEQIPRRIGVLSQTTQIPARFADFTRKLIDYALGKDAEIRIIDTICHDIRDRQAAALDLAGRVDLMLVVGGRFSANTNHLAELCATITVTHHIETADDIQSSWLHGCDSIGVTGGASTAEETVDAVMKKLKESPR